MKIKLAYIGGGSLFVPSIINGIGEIQRISPVPFEVELVLYDLLPQKAERMRTYAGIVQRAWDIPLWAVSAGSRAEVLEGADVVIVSVWLEDAHQRIDQLWDQLGFRMPEEGPGVAAWAAACAPWTLEVAAEMRQRCPEALFLTLMNPTDVLAGWANLAGGVRTAGLCVEVDGLRGALAYYFGVLFEHIELVHAGVNHDGWVLGLQVEGQDGYQLWRKRWKELEANPDYHPGNRGIPAIQALTGHLRSSGYHNWPLQIEETPQETALWKSWRGKRQLYLSALDEALQAGQPISDPPGIHPERSRLNYPYTGRTVGKLAQSIATGLANVIPLQIPNAGAVANFPPDAIVEVPTLVHNSTLHGMAVGELPEWLGGVTRLQAIQRRLIIDYLLDRHPATLQHALAVLPVFTTVQQMKRYAEAVHLLYTSP